jgi:hypothetical protein
METIDAELADIDFEIIDAELTETDTTWTWRRTPSSPKSTWKGPMRHVLAFALCLSALLSACASSRVVKMYGGSEQPASNVAIVRPSMGIQLIVLDERPGVRILRVDGVELERADIDSGAAIGLLPGDHSLTVATTLTIEGRRVSFEDAVPLRCRFEAGAQYSLSCRVTHGPMEDQPVIRFQLEDASGKVVSSTS